jgi:hypothetical protein
MTMQFSRESSDATSQPAVRTTDDGAWHKRVEGLHVLKLRGNDYQMGHQHGRLLKGEIPQGPIPYYRAYIERLLGNTSFGPASPVVWPLLQRFVGRRVIDAFPDFVRDAVRGLADGAELDVQETLQACSMPDALLWVASRLMDVKRVGPAMHHRLALGIGCTSAIAHGGATVDGKLLHARNFDYHGVDCWPKTAAVVFHEPDDGLRYVSVSAAGVLMGGVTAMNEAGLTLTVHQHMFTAETRLGGTPIGVVGDIIMRRARSLDDAEAILAAHKPIGCWTYLISDGRTRELLCWEENPDRQVATRHGGDDTTFGYANIYLDEQLGSTERNLYGSYWRHNLGRQRRIRSLLEEHCGHIDPSTMASFLADAGETRCRIASSIGMVMTVGSVVFRPEDGVLWVATGATPTSSNGFVPFSLGAEDHAPEHGVLEPESADEAARSAFDAYRTAYLDYLDRSDPDGARSNMARACALQPEQPLFHVLHGLLSLQLNDGDAAFASLSRALLLGHDHPERLATFHLWRARASDLRGRRQEGLRDYRAALGHHGDPPVLAAARRGLRQAYGLSQARRMDIDFTYADVVAP